MDAFENEQQTLPALDFHNDGVEIRKAVLPKNAVESVKGDIDLESTKLKQHGVRNLEKRFESIAELASNDLLLSLAESLLDANACLVRALFFDKTPDKNWFVGWHQDKTVTLNKYLGSPEWGPWSIKDGIHHVQPPLAVLDNMVTFRLHVDPADEYNGCLEVIPGSHMHGLLEQNDIDEIVRNSHAVSCVVDAGDLVIMRPHILHRSRKSQQPSHRRVVHLEFSSYELPDGFAWT